MLKTNSKKARENIKNYIIDHYDGCGYDPGTLEADAKTLAEISAVILTDLKRVKGYEVLRYTRYTWEAAFEDYAAGLPGLIDTCYYYNRSAVDDLGALLEETETEKARYTESDAEKMLSKLIYRELITAAPGIL